MPTQPHTPPPHAGAVGAITAAAACPSTLRGMRHRQPAPLVPPHPPLPPPLPHTTCAAAMHTAAAEPTAAVLPHEPPRRSAAAAAACAARCRRCCRCAAAAANVNIQSWLTSAASNYVNQNVNIAKRFHCFLARFKIGAMGGMEYYQEKINC